MNKPIIIIGAGEHATVLLDLLLSQKRDVIALTSLNNLGEKVFGIPIISDIEVISTYKSSDVLLVNGVGSVGTTKLMGSPAFMAPDFTILP